MQGYELDSGYVKPKNVNGGSEKQKYATILAALHLHLHLHLHLQVGLQKGI